ncbi:hypothetical protein BN961_01402 [Afipia felis]|uniref:Uncharacterized protein n=1 Tax=Afipia felis TaxID=1035 RepID=A0A090MKL2_AFIFE|nr:conserved hypothetical protein [Afipia sp. 1NLS2]CEG07995.1 hypothetical protein BN961_01402 [Afipia felis]
MRAVIAYRTPKDSAGSMSRRRKARAADDGYVRETFTLPREEARAQGRLWLDRWPAAAHMSEVEWWRELSGDRIEFRMRRLKSAD